MIQLVVTTQGSSDQIELDTSISPIELNFQYWDLANIMQTRSPYSYNFTLPYSKVNDQFFSFYYNANVADGTFNAGTKTDVQLYVDGVLLMVGVLQLHECGEEAQGYSVTILEQIAKVFDLIKGMTWEQLFTTDAGTVDTDLDHALNWTNVTDSWDTSNDITTGAVGAGVVVYPLADSGAGLSMNSQAANLGQGFWYTIQQGTGGTLEHVGMDDEHLSVLNMKPAIRINYLLKYIFNRVGYTIDSTWLDSVDTNKIYMFLALDQIRAAHRPVYGCQAGVPGSMVISSSNASQWFNLSFTNETTPFYDPDALMNGGNFVAPYDGMYQFTVSVVCETTAGLTYQGYYLYTRMTVNGETVVSDQNQPVYYQTEAAVVHTYQLELAAGDTVVAWVSHTSTSQDVYINQTGAQTATYFLLDQIWGSTTFVDMSANFPDVTVDKWVKAIFERFNLVLVSDQETPTVLRIEPWSDWWEAGTTMRDWTEIVDQDSIKIEPTTRYQKKTYLFSDAEAENFTNRWWQYHFGFVKGQYEFINENDFTTETEKSSDVFQPFRNRQLYPTVHNVQNTFVPNVLLPVFWDWHDGSDGSIYLKEFVPCKPVLAYYNGLQDIGNNGQFTFGGVAYTQYPYFAEYNSVGVDEDTLCLNWGYDYPDNFYAPFVSGGQYAATTLNYAWRYYWSQMFAELYSTDSRIMTCKVNLSYVELYNLQFNDLIYLDGTFWRVMKIENYSLTTDDLASVELIKVLNKPPGRASDNCSARPVSFNTDGTVNFEDANGNPVSPTEVCCTLNGFVWNDDDNVCMSRNPSGGSGGGGNTGGGLGGDGSKPNGNVSNNLPSGFHDFSNGNTKQYQQHDTVAEDIEAQLYLKTTDATPTYANLTSGIANWVIPQDNIVLVRLAVVAVQVGGSAATIGETLTVQYQGTVANTKTKASAFCTARLVGSLNTIAENKDAAVTARAGIVVNQAIPGDVATFSVQCTGQANITYQWFIDMTLTTLQIPGDSSTMAVPIMYNLDPEEQMTGNLSPAEDLYFNLDIP